MMGWKEYKIKDVAVNIFSGGTPSTKNSGYYNGNIPWLNTKEINFRKINGTLSSISESGLLNSAAKWVPENSVIVAMYGVTAGKVAINAIPLTTNQACCNIVVNNDKFDFKFIYYSLYNSYLELKNLSSGAAQQNLNVNIISNFTISLPDLVEQRAIATVLCNLDDKIDLLHRQNATLEAMAEALFKKWFVVEAKEEWEYNKLSYFGKIICGKTPSKSNKHYFNGDIPFIKIPDMHSKIFIDHTSDTLSVHGADSQRNKYIPKNSICVSCIATVGLVSISTKNSQTNQQINTIIPFFSYYLYYIFLYMRYLKDELISLASGGTATLNLNTSDFSDIEIPTPPLTLLKKFEEEIKPIFNKIWKNQSQIKILEKLRDTLLPKLMSGEVRVSLN